MKNSIHKIVAQVVQVSDTITNTQPLIFDVQGMRKQLTDAVVYDAVTAETAEALRHALDDAERELAEPTPRRRRLREIVRGMTALAGGISASAGLVDSIDAFTRTVNGVQ
jgi:hypothetical protein